MFSGPYATRSYSGNQVQYSLCKNKVHAVQLASIGVCAVQNVTQDTAHTMCRMADGLDSQDEEEEAEQSPSGSHPSPTPSHDPAAGSVQSVPVRSPHAAIREVDRATSLSIDQDIAAALAADAAFFEDPALSLGEGALQPLGGGHGEGYEQPALSAGGTVSKVQPPMPPLITHHHFILCHHGISRLPSKAQPSQCACGNGFSFRYLRAKGHDSSASCEAICAGGADCFQKGLWPIAEHILWKSAHWTCQA